MTWDGQPAGEMGAAIEAVIAAAWCAGRDAAIAKCDKAALAWNDLSAVNERAGAYAAAAAAIASSLSKLTPPPDLGSTLRPGGARMTPERQAAAIVGVEGVEALSAAGLLIVTADRMAALIDARNEALKHSAMASCSAGL